jgi:hypothetical protein
VKFTHAQILRALGRDPAQVDALAREAIAAYDIAGAAYAARSADARAWLAAQQPTDP